MNLTLPNVPPASTVRALLADGGTHLFEGGQPIATPVRDPVKRIRKYKRTKEYKTGGVFARLRALRVGDKPLIEPKKHQPHAGAFANRFGGKFTTKTLGCGTLVEIRRVA